MGSVWGAHRASTAQPLRAALSCPSGARGYSTERGARQAAKSVPRTRPTPRCGSCRDFHLTSKESS